MLEWIITAWACSSVGRAPALQAGGRRFEPGHVHHLLPENFCRSQLHQNFCLRDIPVSFCPSELGSGELATQQAGLLLRRHAPLPGLAEWSYPGDEIVVGGVECASAVPHGGNYMPQIPACPVCRGSRVSRSRRKHLIEKVISALTGVFPYRCLDCETRFFAKMTHQHGEVLHENQPAKDWGLTIEEQR